MELYKCVLVNIYSTYLAAIQGGLLLCKAKAKAEWEKVFPKTGDECFLLACLNE